MIDERERRRLCNELRVLLRQRSLDLKTWEGVWRGAGAPDGVIADFDIGIARRAVMAVKQIPTLDQTKKRKGVA